MYETSEPVRLCQFNSFILFYFIFMSFSVHGSSQATEILSSIASIIEYQEQLCSF